MYQEEQTQILLGSCFFLYLLVLSALPHVFAQAKVGKMASLQEPKRKTKQNKTQHNSKHDSEMKTLAVLQIDF